MWRNRAGVAAFQITWGKLLRIMKSFHYKILMRKTFEDKLCWDFRIHNRRAIVCNGLAQCAGYRRVKDDLVSRMSVRTAPGPYPMSPRLHIPTDTYATSAGRDSAVGIATRYGLDRPGIESRWGRDFPHPSRPTLGSTHPPAQCKPSHSRG
jgi:hypothetical protein